MVKTDSARRVARASRRRMALGGGGRFAALKSKLSRRRGVTDPGALAAWIGRKKYGKARFRKLAAKGK